MPTQVPLFRPTRELRFSASDIAAIRAAEGTHGPVVELHHRPRPRASFAVIFRRAMIAYIAFVLLICGHSLLGRLWIAIESSLSEPPAQMESEPEQDGRTGTYLIRSSPQRVSGVAVSSLSEIEAELNTLPLRQPPVLLDDMVKVEPPEVVPGDGPELEKAAPREREPETHGEPRILDPGFKGQSGCQAVAQPQIDRPHARATEDANKDESDSRDRRLSSER
jgi:hypothetical protein